jgi:hypothetical protein
MQQNEFSSIGIYFPKLICCGTIIALYYKCCQVQKHVNWVSNYEVAKMCLQNLGFARI